jgi:uncharacterized membrane protein YhhN
VPVPHPLLLAPYLLLTVAHLFAQAASADGLAAVTQALLMPALAAYVVAARSDSRLVRLTLVALGFSWLGDTVPRALDGDGAFIAMVGCFLLAQVSYVIAFRPFAAASVLHQRRQWAAAYVLAVLALMAACLPGAGVLAPAVLGYGGCLLAMAVLATGVHRLTWAGGALFLVSDGLIALDAFATGLPGVGQHVVVMATYTAAQLLIVLGVLARARVDVATPAPTAAAAAGPGSP